MTNENGAVSLKVMAEKKVEGVNKQTSFKVDPRLIEIEEGFNARPIDYDHVKSFKASIRDGAAIPQMYVRVENGKIILTDGHHRLTAYLELIEEGLNVVSVDVAQFRGSDADRIAHMLTTSQGLPLTPLQSGAQYRKLFALGWTEKAIAARVGKSITTISQYMALAESDSDVQGMVTRKEVAAHIAIKAVKKHGSGAGKVLEGHLQTARTQGKQKVTAKHTEGATPTRSLADAIQMDMDSGGSLKAEELCPRYAHLIAYLRNAKTIESLVAEMKEVS